MARKKIGGRLRVTSGNFIFIAIPVLFSLAALEGIVTGIDNVKLPDGSNELEYEFASHAVVQQDGILEELKEANEIPVLTNPRVAPKREAQINPNQIGTVVTTSSGASRFYPEYLTNWHLVINDTIDSTPIVISYSPIIDLRVAMERLSEDQEFTDAGKIWNSVHLMVDTQSRSYWSPLHAEAVEGPQVNQGLSVITTESMTFRDFLTRQAGGDAALAPEVSIIDYARDPYHADREATKTLIEEKWRFRQPPVKSSGVAIFIDDTPHEFILLDEIQDGEEKEISIENMSATLKRMDDHVAIISGQASEVDIDIAQIPRYLYDHLSEIQEQ